MGDPVFSTVVGVGAALTKMFLRACDAAFAADLVGDGQELLGTLLRALHRTDGSRGQIERRISQTLANRIQASILVCSRGFAPRSKSSSTRSPMMMGFSSVLSAAPRAFQRSYGTTLLDGARTLNLQLSHISTSSLRQSQHSTLLSPHGPTGFRLRRSRAFFLE